jgi:DNA-binding XRE family transcriptional regulator
VHGACSNLHAVNKLKKAREDAGLSQSELARLIDSPQATISALENDRIKRPSHDLVVRLCRALRRKPEEIFPVAVAS